ncbi:VPS10 domain-containing protein [Tunicatimonas pelagia]|uniref:VPS10 domain-containing protein n=1 Tax=Tunicatimonas pelagia TaxID=931531 RepID=UPI0026671277|nr:glycosyl hydrolase [Tunicatimonas pelagia]WKN44381.1 glycosyl hydrolase [Tunicatimonas pelagia]
MLLRLLLTLSIFFFGIYQVDAQRRSKSAEASAQFDEKYYDALRWRNIGPFRGGRSTTATGVVGQPQTYYFGATGGGVWKTTNAGHSWNNVTDGFFKTGSVGSVAVSESDPNVLYVGTGEAPVRGVKTSHGDGVYKSTDAGRTWENIGLEKTRQISKVRIHPENPDVVYVAAQGSPWAPTDERGIYRTQDGGKSWEKTLFVDENSGACDLAMDATNPRVMYATFWDHQRTPWKIRSGGEGSGIYKTTDGGDSWNQLTTGLPDSIMGKIGITISPANPDRVWAIIESEQGGLYRSDDAGSSWKLINEDRVLRARSWYYMHIFAHPTNENMVYVLNAPFMKSIDGGKTFEQVSTPHGDNHDLWINPNQPDYMINANDGGANISFDGGKSWSTQQNQPTAQFYRVSVDNRFPYYVYGGQQDNSTVAIPSRTNKDGIYWEDFYRVGGCESAFVAFDPDNPEHIYAGCYQGIISEYDANRNETRDVMAYAFQGLGSKPAEVKYRFNWNAPILVSQHDPSVIYHAGNVVLKSANRGNQWEEISPDLTQNDTTNLDYGGGPITKEGAGGEVYHTIAYLAESPHNASTLWVGSDDGLVHVTQDGGESWSNVTPSEIGEALINTIEVSPHEPGTAYLAVTRYKFNDFTPHIFKTTDYGKSWSRLVDGIADEAFVRVVREDPQRKDLLYAGTETGLYASFDGGQQWQPFQLNLPVVPITDLQVHRNDLVAATQGRAFWILDDLTPLHQLNESIKEASTFLFQPRDTYKTDGSRDTTAVALGENPVNGTAIYYYLNEVPEDDSLALTLEILNEEDSVIRSYASNAEKEPQQAPKKAGMNHWVWNLYQNDYEEVKGLMPFQGMQSYRVMPGEYQVRLAYGEDTLTQSFNVLMDPRVKATEAQLAEKEQHLETLDQSVKDLYQSVRKMQNVRELVKSMNERLCDDELNAEVVEAGEKILDTVDELQGKLVQMEQKTFQDVINFPNQLDTHLKHLKNIIDASVPPVTNGQQQRFTDMMSDWQNRKSEIQQLMEETIPDYNRLIQDNNIPYIATEQKEVTETAMP